MTDPWAFGWTQLLTLFGFAITIAIAVSGFRTFGRWKREKIEERRIEAAIDALALAYESQIVFRSIRSGFSNSHEYKEMAVVDGDTPDRRSLRGSYWVIGKRIYDNKEYFDRVWKSQPVMTAIFGEQMQRVFESLHEARSLVQVASQTMAWDEPPLNTEDNRKLSTQLRNDLWGISRETDRVEKSLEDFRKGVERMCKPVVDREFGRNRERGLFAWTTTQKPLKRGS